MYEDLIARAASSRRPRKPFEAANLPFVDRCGSFSIHPSSKSSPRASRTLKDLETLSAQIVEFTRNESLNQTRSRLAGVPLLNRPRLNRQSKYTISVLPPPSVRQYLRHSLHHSLRHTSCTPIAWPHAAPRCCSNICSLFSCFSQSSVSIEIFPPIIV